VLHPQSDSAGNNAEVIPSAKATLEAIQRLSHQPRAAEEDRIAALMRSVIGIAGITLAIVSPTIASAATIEEVAHCRAIPQLAERLNCFKSLKPGPRTKTEDAAPAKKRDIGSSKVKSVARAKLKQAAPAKTEQAAPANKEQAAPNTEHAAPANAEQAAPAATEQVAPRNTEHAAPANAEQAAPSNTEHAAPATTEQAAPRNMEQAAPNTEQAAPANAETTTKSSAGEALFSPTPDDPATTSSIDRLSVAGQPLCVDAESVAAMLLAGLLTPDPKSAATHGCQILPDDARLELLERLPSVFPSIRIVRVRVTSPTQPDLTFGFTIETGRYKAN
jgi:hypothetical protein